MSRRALLILLGVLAALAVVAGLGTLGQRSGGGSDGDLFIPGLKARINDLDRVVVRTAGNTTVATLVRGEDGWTVEEKNYPADLARLRRNLVGLGDASRVEEKTSNPGLYSRIGVEEVSESSARGVELELSGPAGSDPLRVIIGDTGVSGGKLAYVRQAGEATSWLVAADLDPGRSTAEWLDRHLMDLPADRVHAVTITQPDGTVLRLRKDTRDQQHYTVLDIPRGHSLNFEGVGDGIAAVLAELKLDDVQPRDVLGDSPGKPVVARFETFDGLVVEVSAWRLEEGTRLSFQASADEALAARFPADANGSPGTADDGADEEAGQASTSPDRGGKAPRSFQEAQAEAAALNERLGGWIYTVPSYKAEQLTRRPQDLTSPSS
jgi:hypothetical protein